MLHGLTGSPWDLRPLANAFVGAGFCVEVPTLAGHSDLESLEASRAEDWIAASDAALQRCRARGSQVAVLGFSMGSLLALRLAASHEDLACVIAMSVPLELEAWKRRGARLLSRLRRVGVGPLGFRSLIGHHNKQDGVDVRSGFERARNPGFDKIPYASIYELARLQDFVRPRLPAIRVPLLLLHGRHDHAAPVQDSARVSQAVSSKILRRVVLPHSYHLLARDLDRQQVRDEALHFSLSNFASQQDTRPSP